MVILYDEETSRWKYLILLSSFFVHLIIWGFAYGAGVFQVIFLEEFGDVGTSGPISIVTSLVATLAFFAGPISSVLTNRFGCRLVSWFGTIIAVCGFLLTSMVTSLWQLYVTFSLLGIGFGIAYIPSVVIVCHYFERKRPLAMALACTGLGVGTFVIPLLIRFLVNYYHWRNAMLILSGLTLNMVVCSSLFRPTNKATDESSVSKKKIIRVKMFRQTSFWCLMLNNFFVLYGMVTFFIHLPAYLRTVNYSDDQGALFVSLIGAGAVLGRLMTGCLTQCLNAPLILYTITMGMSGLMVMLVPFFVSYVPLSLTCFSFGLCSSTIGPLLPLIITDLLGLDALSDGYGYILVAEGIGSSLGPPIAGFLFDFNHTYTLPMVLSGSLMVFASFVMFLPWWHLRKSKFLAETTILS